MESNRSCHAPVQVQEDEHKKEMDDLYLPPRSRKTLQQINQSESEGEGGSGRGRKRKKKTDESESSGDDGSGDEERPKKRGRPRGVAREDIKVRSRAGLCNNLESMCICRCSATYFKFKSGFLSQFFFY
jgi:hypothetical protein